MHLPSEDDIVISGVSGRYPNSDSLNEFWDNLMSGQPLFTPDERWPPSKFFSKMKIVYEASSQKHFQILFSNQA